MSDTETRLLVQFLRAYSELLGDAEDLAGIGCSPSASLVLSHYAVQRLHALLLAEDGS